MNEEKRMTVELFNCVNSAIDKFKEKHPDFFTQEGYGSVSANALCMLTACFIQRAFQEAPLNIKLKALDDIMNMNKEYLLSFDYQDKFISDVNCN